ncbi:M15 family metallopeptidase [Nocardia pseudovaccinii]|uniref:M15 family metallopeptidase n=1 Tax=Nocardia pseudovaccinii TaxID=189540 RepID=UPI000A0623CB|nr:M15 family metallopeptidase [Nocardia pseudovaccinii]
MSITLRTRTMLGVSAALFPVIVAAGLSMPTAAAAPIVQVAGNASGTEGLEPGLAAAYTQAENQAHAEGVGLYINSGYRTPAEQQALWDDGVRTYGSPEEARRWVLPPNESTHVQGRAIDVGPQAGAQWLEANGNRWGLCRIYQNEWWHFELATAPGGACPALRADASGGGTAPAPSSPIPPVLPGLPSIPVPPWSSGSFGL